MGQTVKEQSEEVAKNVIEFFGTAHPEPGDHALLAREMRAFAIRWAIKRYDIPVADPEADELKEYAQRALIAYMEHYSETCYAASWLTGMHESLHEHDPTYDWLVDQAGGHYNDKREFVPS